MAEEIKKGVSLENLQEFRDYMEEMIDKKIAEGGGGTGGGVSEEEFEEYKTTTDAAIASNTTAIAGKANAAHTHTIANVSGLETRLASNEDATNKASLFNGKMDLQLTPTSSVKIGRYNFKYGDKIKVEYVSGNVEGTDDNITIKLSSADDITIEDIEESFQIDGDDYKYAITTFENQDGLYDLYIADESEFALNVKVTIYGSSDIIRSQSYTATSEMTGLMSAADKNFVDTAKLFTTGIDLDLSNAGEYVIGTFLFLETDKVVIEVTECSDDVTYIGNEFALRVKNPSGNYIDDTPAGTPLSTGSISKFTSTGNYNYVNKRDEFKIVSKITAGTFKVRVYYTR